MAVPQLSDSQTPRTQVPHLNRDPVWSLRPWPVLVTLAHHEWQIPALPAADWLAILMADNIDPDDILPGLLDKSDAQELEELLVTGDVTLQDLQETCLDVIAVASARSWWVALRLIFVIRESWDNLGAELILRHIDPNHMSLAAWLDAAMLVLLKVMEPKQVPMFTMQLEAPPEGESIPEEDMVMNADAFLSMG